MQSTAPTLKSGERLRKASQSSRAIAESIALVVLTSAVFVFACVWLEIRTLGSLLGLGLLVWLSVSLPMAVTDGLFMKLDPMVILSHSLSWIVKLTILAGAASWVRRNVASPATGASAH